MNQKTALVVMAAGIGSRFGQGIKQLTAFGPDGEIIIDYSIHDAIEAGFDRVIFVIRKDIEAEFREVIGDRIARRIPVDYAFQELTDLPDGILPPQGRTKPWGTGQAILACKDLVEEPFAVINADDFYGKQAYRKVHDFLISPKMDEIAASGRIPVCMAGFILRNTLSAYGGVTRGICSFSPDGHLSGITETRGIEICGDAVQYPGRDLLPVSLDPETTVSMNFWGYHPSIMGELKKRFSAFLRALTPETELTAEYLLPTIVNDMLLDGTAKVHVTRSADHWFGVTFCEDIPSVKRELRELTGRGIYPSPLWSAEK